MSDPTIAAALDAAAKRLCICDGECFETRHGMMHGPCEARPKAAAAAVAAFLRAMPAARGIPLFGGSVVGWDGKRLEALADAIERAGGGNA